MGMWHLTFASRGRRVILPGEPALLEGVRAIARGAPGVIVLFCIVDDHVHVVVQAVDPGRVAASLLRALRAVSEAELEPAHCQEVANRRHLEWLADQYILKQPVRHGLRVHPALWPGSCFLDLIGARRIPGLTLQLGNALPRYRLRRAFVAVGLEGVPLELPGAVELRALGASRIVQACAAAAGSPDASVRSQPARRARLVAAALCQEASIPSGVLAMELGYHVGSVCRLITQTCHAGDRRAALTRLSLENRIANSATSPRAHQSGS